MTIIVRRARPVVLATPDLPTTVRPVATDPINRAMLSASHDRWRMQWERLIAENSRFRPVYNMGTTWFDLSVAVAQDDSSIGCPLCHTNHVRLMADMNQSPTLVCGLCGQHQRLPGVYINVMHISLDHPSWIRWPERVQRKPVFRLQPTYAARELGFVLNETSPHYGVILNDSGAYIDPPPGSKRLDEIQHVARTLMAQCSLCHDQQYRCDLSCFNKQRLTMSGLAGLTEALCRAITCKGNWWTVNSAGIPW